MKKLILLLPFLAACVATQAPLAVPTTPTTPSVTTQAAPCDGDEELVRKTSELLDEAEAACEKFRSYLTANNFETCQNAGANNLTDQFNVFLQKVSAQLAENYEDAYAEAKDSLEIASKTGKVCKLDDLDKVQDAMFEASVERVRASMVDPLRQCRDALIEALPVAE